MPLLIQLAGTSVGAIKAWQKKKAGGISGKVISRKVTRTIENAPSNRKQPKPPGTPSGSGTKAKKQKVGRPKKAYKVVAGRPLKKPVIVKGTGKAGPAFKGGVARKTK